MIDFLILIFTYLPDLFIHLIVLIGLLGLTFSIFNIPIIVTFLPPRALKYISMGLIILGLFLEGGLAVNNEYLARSREWNSKIEMAEKKAESINENIKYIYIDRVSKIEKVKYIVKEKIKAKAQSIDQDCKITSDVIEIHNYAAKGLDK